MQIDAKKCVGCGQCVPYCPMGAISIMGRKALIDQQECVECNVCYKNNICRLDAFIKPELAWPRELREQYSDPRAKHPKTNMGGRGTEEVKTNDVTGRVKCGEAGLAVEMGRPGVGTTFREVEKMTKALSPLGIEWELANPIVTLFDLESGRFREDVLDEKVLSCILEFTLPMEKLELVLRVIKDTAGRLETVFSLDFISTYDRNGELPGLDIVKKAGFIPRPNAKYNIGMGRPLYHQNQPLQKG